MPKKYFTTTKTGEEVEVDSSMASQLVKMGKKKPEDFTPIEEIPYVEPVIQETPMDPAGALGQADIPRSDRQFTHTTPEERAEYKNLPWYKKAALSSGKKLTETLINPLRIGFTPEDTDYDLPEDDLFGYGSMTGFSPATHSGLGPKQEAKKKEILETETLPFEEKSYGDFVSGLSELSTDFGLMMAPGGNIRKGVQGIKAFSKVPAFWQPAVKGAFTGAGHGAYGAGLHQMERFGEGRDPSLLSGGLETLVSTALPGFGGAMGSQFKKWAPGTLRQSVKPARKFMEKYNPPNFEVPLEKNLVGKWGGLEKALVKTDDLVSDLGKQRNKAVLKANATVNLDEVKKEVSKELSNLSKKGMITDSQYKGALSHADDMHRTGANMSSSVKTEAVKGFKPPKPVKGEMKSGFNSQLDAAIKRYGLDPKLAQTIKTKSQLDAALERRGLGKITPTTVKATPEKTTISGKDAVRLRILADKNSKFNVHTQPAQEAYGPLYNEVYRNVLSKQLASKIPDYKKLTTEMSKYIPFGKAVDYRLGQQSNNFRFGLLDYASMGVGMGAGGIPGAVTGSAINRLFTRPGGAKIQYDLGRRLTEDSGGRLGTNITLRDLLMSGGRSAAFGGGE